AKKTAVLRAGGSIGIGWTFAGELYRTQAYPPRGAKSPYDWVKCTGPDNPPGTFRYCNQLDKDADHYDGFAEPNWFQGGARPLISPWVAFPQLGLTVSPSPKFALDLEAGLTLSGILTGLGFRFGL